MELRRRTLFTVLAAALAVASCASFERQVQRPGIEVRPLQTVRHGMSAEQLYQVGRELQLAGRDDEALGAFRMALMTDPRHADAHNALGVIYSLQGKAKLAEEEFRIAVALAPQAEYLLQNLAHHLARNAPSIVASYPVPEALPSQAAAPEIVAAVSAPEALPAPEAAPAPVLEQLSPSVWQLRTKPGVQVPVPDPVAVTTRASVAAPRALDAPADPATATSPGAYRVEVTNGNGTEGLAHRVSLRLPPEAYQPARLTNHKPYGVELSMIEHVDGAEAAVAEVNARLPTALPVYRVQALERNARIRILLGRDFPSDPARWEAAAPSTRVASR